MQPGEALAFGATLAVGSVLVLGVLVNWFAAALLAFTIFFYVFVYTMWLKRSTPQNIVIGGAAGAFPPMIGWAAVTGDVSLAPVLMFLIIFFWTPPHFWALALLQSDDYARAGVPMLPVVAGHDETRRQILLYSLVLAPVGLAPSLFGFAGLVYGAVALVCGAVMLHAVVARLARAHRARLPPPRRASCSPSRCSMCSCCSPRCSSTTSSCSFGLVAMNETTDDDGIVLTAEQKRRRRGRSIAIALSLGLFVVLFYVVTREAGRRC